MAAEPLIGTKIKRARERLLMSQEELAEKLRVSRSAVNSWERGRSYPRNRIGALEEVLGIDLTGDAQPPPGPFDDLYPLHEDWEAGVLADPDLPDRIKRDLIQDSRVARAAHAARKRERADRSLRDPGRAAG
jgi:transcriptional regulator with XRE-family HTH domain